VPADPQIKASVEWDSRHLKVLLFFFIYSLPLYLIFLLGLFLFFSPPRFIGVVSREGLMKYDFSSFSLTCGEISLAKFRFLSFVSP